MYFPTIDRNKCTNCFFCVNICPKNVFEVKDNEVEVENPTFCNGCEACVAECPEDAVTVRET
ncbi:MAG: 4Fe-4S dicluster domain-containing protein [Deltaproteobacteria bacterium]|nr:4Fe-4S dicluster domain-containing protein [Deltaproteobacteria bacterium]